MKQFLGYLVFLMFFWSFPLLGKIDKILKEANTNFTLGEQATTFVDRKQAFNRSLVLFSLIERDKGTNIPALNEVLGDNFFQLEDYPWAILHYQRALKSDKENLSVLHRLEKAQQKLSLQPETSKTTHFLADFQKFHFLFWLSLVLLVLYSFAIWLHHPWIFILANSISVLLFSILLYMTYTYYSSPIEGILVESTGFYRAPEWTEPQLSPFPLIAGSKVSILQMTPEGNWLKIQSRDQIGYIPTKSLRLI